MVGATMIDNGYPTIEASPRFVFFLRVGTPVNILTRLARAFRRAIQEREIDAKIQRSRVESENRSLAETAKMLRRSTKNGATWRGQYKGRGGIVRRKRSVNHQLDSGAITRTAGISRKCLKEEC
jgi:hypothetical protein